MLTAFIIWLIGVASGISLLIIMSGVILGVIAFCVGGHLCDEGEKIWCSTVKKLVACSFSCLLVAFMIPNKETAYLMVAGYIAQETITSDTGQKLVQVVNIELDKIIKEGLKNGN